MENGVKVVADFERHPGGEFDELHGWIDHPVISHKFAKILTGESDPPPCSAISPDHPP